LKLLSSYFKIHYLYFNFHRGHEVGVVWVDVRGSIFLAKKNIIVESAEGLVHWIFSIKLDAEVLI